MNLTPAQAEEMHYRANERSEWLVWHVSTSVVDRPGKVVAWAVVVDTTGGTRQPGELVADTLDELRAMLPLDLTRHERTMMMPADVVETWD